MPFGLTNAPSTFIRLMNQVLEPVIGRFVVVYCDDILIYSRSEEDHAQHLHEVLTIQSKEKLNVNLEKCHFFTAQVVILGHVVFTQGIHVDESKIKAIQEWPVPTSIQQVWSFHVLASFYIRFVRDFCSIVSLMIAVLKGRSFQSTNQPHSVLEEIKRRLTREPILTLPSFSKIFEVECDASGVGIGAVLS